MFGFGGKIRFLIVDFRVPALGSLIEEVSATPRGAGLHLLRGQPTHHAQMYQIVQWRA
jgi:hypothetical protein